MLDSGFLIRDKVKEVPNTKNTPPRAGFLVFGRKGEAVRHEGKVEKTPNQRCVFRVQHEGQGKETADA